MASPVGLNAGQTMASIRAGICRFAESAFMGQNFSLLVLSLLPSAAFPVLIDDGLLADPRYIRILQLAALAFDEGIEDQPMGSEIPLFLGVPEVLQNEFAVDPERFIADFEAQTGAEFDRSASEVFPSGRAAGLVALEKAVEAVQSGACEFALAEAVDTYCDARLLAYLEDEQRIKGPGVMGGKVLSEILHELQ